MAIVFSVMIGGTRIVAQETTGEVPVTAAGKPAEGPIDPFLGEQDRYEGIRMARFNLAWLLNGASTGDGEVPDRVTEAAETQGN